LFYFPATANNLYALDYIWFGVLGIGGCLIATLLPVVFYRLRYPFLALPFQQALNPAIGGLGVGLIALKFPHVVGGGYGWIQVAFGGGY
jgi:CIC family chloride channel protein